MDGCHFTRKIVASTIFKHCFHLLWGLSLQFTTAPLLICNSNKSSTFYGVVLHHIGPPGGSSESVLVLVFILVILFIRRLVNVVLGVKAKGKITSLLCWYRKSAKCKY